MPELHKIEEIKVYCGPAALMAITGKRLPEVRSAINAVRDMRDNQGVIRLSLTNLEKSLNKLDVTYEKLTPAKRTSLSNLVDNSLEKDVRYIVYITGHYLTVLNELVMDNHYRFGTDITDCRWSGKIVKAYLKISD